MDVGIDALRAIVAAGINDEAIVGMDVSGRIRRCRPTGYRGKD